MAYNNNRGGDEIVFKIVGHIGVLAEYQTGWSKEVNIVAWNDGAPKIDIRDWNPEHTRLTKGITLYEEEARKLAELLGERFNSPGKGTPVVPTQGETVAARAKEADGASESLVESGAASGEKSNAEVNTLADLSEEETPEDEED